MYVSQTSRDSHASATQPEFFLVKKSLKYSYFISFLAKLEKQIFRKSF